MAYFRFTKIVSNVPASIATCILFGHTPPALGVIPSPTLMTSYMTAHRIHISQPLLPLNYETPDSEVGEVQLQDTNNHTQHDNTINSIPCDPITMNTTLLFTQTSQPLLQVQHVPLLHWSGLTVNNSVQLFLIMTQVTTSKKYQRKKTP